MRPIIFIFTLLFVVLTATAQDDIYLNPDDYSYSETFVEESVDGDTYVTNNYYMEEDDYDYGYSSRIRRFHRPYNGFSYYDNCYVDRYFYDYDPYYWGSSIYYRPNWSIGISFGSPYYGGWGGSYVSSYYGWGNYRPYYNCHTPSYYYGSPWGVHSSFGHGGYYGYNNYNGHHGHGYNNGQYNDYNNNNGNYTSNDNGYHYGPRSSRIRSAGSSSGTARPDRAAVAGNAGTGDVMPSNGNNGYSQNGQRQHQSEIKTGTINRPEQQNTISTRPSGIKDNNAIKTKPSEGYKQEPSNARPAYEYQAPSNQRPSAKPYNGVKEQPSNTKPGYEYQRPSNQQPSTKPSNPKADQPRTGTTTKPSNSNSGNSYIYDGSKQGSSAVKTNPTPRVKESQPKVQKQPKSSPANNSGNKTKSYNPTKNSSNKSGYNNAKSNSKSNSYKGSSKSGSSKMGSSKSSSKSSTSKKSSGTSRNKRR